MRQLQCSCGLLIPDSQSVTQDGLNYQTLVHPYQLDGKVYCGKLCRTLASIAKAFGQADDKGKQLELPLEFNFGESHAVQTSSVHDTRYASTRFGWVGAS